MGFESVLSSLVGGAIDLFGGVSTNKQNARNVENTNRLNYQIFKEQNKFNLDQWKRNNDYNTPLAQRLRFQQAGINPALALSNITSGISNPVQSAGANPMQSAQAVNAYNGLGNSVGEAMDRYINAQVADSEVRKNDADADRLNALAEGQRIDNANKPEAHRANVDNQNSSTNLNNKNANRIDTITPHDVARIQADISRIKEDTDFIRSQKQLADYNLKNMAPLQREKLRSEVGQIYATAKYLSANSDLSRAQIAFIAEQKLTEVARRNNINWDTNMKRALLPFELNLKDAQVKQIGANIRGIDSQIDKTEYDKWMQAWNNTNSTINAIIPF